MTDLPELSAAATQDVPYMCFDKRDTPFVRALIDAYRTGQLVERDGVAGLVRCLGFFASVIRSGEPWTDTCEREYRAALTAIKGGGDD